jgi:protein-S-isoprenylcysteine O-methyltransferase Ste14
MPKKREGWAAEHPRCDRIQNGMILVFLGVWVLDTFIFNVTTLRMLLPTTTRLLLAVPLFVIGVYLVRSSHNTIFSDEDGQQVLVITGVYRLCRHPMYLGVMTILLSLSLYSFSISSIIIVAGLFIFYNRFATYEEERLEELFGDEYREYQNQVSKWIPSP